MICYNIQKEKSLGVLVYRSMSVDGRQEIVKYDYGRMDVNLRDYGKNIFLGNDLTDEDIVLSCSTKKSLCIHEHKALSDKGI